MTDPNIYINSISDIANASNSKAILIGDALFAGLTDKKIDDFTHVTKRPGASSSKSFFNKNSPKVFISVSDEILEIAPKNFNCAFAVDAYLKFGFSTNGTCILLSGMSTASSTHIHIFIFNNGSVLNVLERTLPSAESPHYSETASGLVDELKMDYEGSVVYCAAPLPPFGETVKNINYLDHSIYKNITYQKLTLTQYSASNNAKLPVILAIIGAISYVGFIGKGWTEYSAASSSYETISADPILKNEGAAGSAIIEKLQQQRFFMLTPRTQIELVQRTNDLVTAISKIDNARIVSMVVNTPNESGGTNNELPPISIILSIPRSNRLVLEQAKEMLDVITANSKISLHMTQNGWRDVESNRLITFEGAYTLTIPVPNLDASTIKDATRK